MAEKCPLCGQRSVVFVVSDKWRCKSCGKYLTWADLEGGPKG